MDWNDFVSEVSKLEAGEGKGLDAAELGSCIKAAFTALKAMSAEEQLQMIEKYGN